MFAVYGLKLIKNNMLIFHYKKKQMQILLQPKSVFKTRFRFFYIYVYHFSKGIDLIYKTPTFFIFGIEYFELVWYNILYESI